MEQIFFNVNPSLKQLLDNVQRTSDLLQKEQIKEVKREKTRGLGAVDYAELSDESTLLGEELLGSMDPDLFRQRRTTTYQEELEKRRQEPRRELIGDEKRHEREKERDKRSGDEGSAQRDDLPESVAEEEVASPEERISAEKVTLPSAEPPPEGPPPEEKKGEISFPSMEKVRISLKARAQEKKAQESQRETTIDSKAQKSSIVIWDEGFIIADPKKKILAFDDSGAGKMEEGDIDRTETIQEGDAEDLSQILDEIVISPTDSATLPEVKEALSLFGRGVLALCREFGTRVVLVPEVAEAFSLFEPSLGQVLSRLEAVRAAYVPEERVVLVAEVAAKAGDGGGELLFCFAHAFDHALGCDDFASLKSAAVLSNFRACQKGEPGRIFVDSFASLSPVHYFAQAVESYLQGPRGRLKVAQASSGVLCSKEEFYDIDRSMFLYVEYLFREINRGATDASCE